jgi:Mg-chelatase subunit ChlD
MSEPNLNVYMLLDRSSSMNDRWEEALGSINAYVEELAKDGKPAQVTLATFDHMGELLFEVVRDKIDVRRWVNVTNADATPRGGTPLFDAFGRIVALAEDANEGKTAIVVMTDGEENSSREMNRQQAEACRERCKKREWPVVFLGAEFQDVTAQAAAVGVGHSNQINVAKGFYAANTRRLASKMRSYQAGDDKDIVFNEEDRKIAAGEADDLSWKSSPSS